MSKYGTAADIRATMRDYYPSKEWALMFEVSNDAGFSRSRSADAVAMNLWPSRGLRIHGFEIKVSRSDLLNELKQPEKCEAIAKYCDHWWLVGPREIFPDDVLAKIPPSWGIMVYTAAVGDGSGKPAKPATLKVFRDAPALPKADDSNVLPRGFVACLLRRASEADAEEINAIVEKRIGPIRAQVEERIKQGIESRSSRSTSAVEIVEKFKQETGIDLNHFTVHGSLIPAVNAVINSKILQEWTGLKALSKSLAGINKEIDAVLKFAAKQEIPAGMLVERPKLPEIGNTDQSALTEEGA